MRIFDMTVVLCHQFEVKVGSLGPDSLSRRPVRDSSKVATLMEIDTPTACTQTCRRNPDLVWQWRGDTPAPLLRRRSYPDCHVGGVHINPLLGAIDHRPQLGGASPSAW